MQRSVRLAFCFIRLLFLAALASAISDHPLILGSTNSSRRDKSGGKSCRWVQPVTAIHPTNAFRLSPVVLF